MPSIMKGKRPGQYVLPDEGKVVELVEQAENEIYDTIQVANGAVTAGKQYKFFDVVEDKNLQHSSFTTPHKLIGVDEFTLQSIGLAPVQAFGAVLTDARDFLHAVWNAALEFKINRRPIVKGPGAFFQPGIGVTGGIATTNTAVERASLTNGVPSGAAVRKLKVEQPIVGEVDVLEATLTWYDNAWLTGGSSMATINTATNGLGVMFVGHGIEKNGLGK